VITCTSCGKLTYESIGNCQHCGALLPGKIGGGVDPKKGAPELPSWLESLRAGEQPAASTGDQQNNSIADFIDKNALPSWMRPESAEYISADQSSPLWSASTPASNAGGSSVPPEGISANSLIDEQSLPSWMQEHQSAPPFQRDIQASSLLQPEALPEWIRNAPQQPAARAETADSPTPAIPPQGILGNSLIDPQAIPAWMSGHRQDGSEELTSVGVQSGLAARALVDMNALPNWLRESGQEQRSVHTETKSPGQSEQTPTMSGNLSAPSLIDMKALPNWLRPATEQGSAEKPASPSPAYGLIPPRVESVRVPSRPRGEMGPREQSEVAANVFASMLGVAASTSHLSSQPPQASVYPPPGQSQPQQVRPQMSGVAPGPQLGVMGSAPMAGYSPAPGGYPHNQQSRTPQYPPANPAAMPLHSQADPNARSIKRGFLETIRSWFSR
jgi:hypothetical protein